MKRKLASIILAITMILTLFPMTGIAAPKIGDPIGDILYSDIIAYIDGKAIPTSIKSGTTLVVVEDLARYGFDVVWNNSDRTLKVECNATKKFIPLPVERDTTHKSGAFKCKYFYTNIKTYLSGQLVESFAIDGVTLIDFELLVKYGKLNWNGMARELSLALTKNALTDAALKSAIANLPRSDAVDILWWRLKGYWTAVDGMTKLFVGFNFQDGVPSIEYGYFETEFWRFGKITGGKSTGIYEAELDFRLPAVPENELHGAYPAEDIKVYLDLSGLNVDGKIKIKTAGQASGGWNQYAYGGMTLMEAYNNFY
jgi:hypothetical protein